MPPDLAQRIPGQRRHVAAGQARCAATDAYAQRSAVRPPPLGRMVPGPP